MFKIFKRQKIVYQDNTFDKARFDEMIQSVKLIYSSPSEEFYVNLLKLFIPDFLDNTNPIHKQFNEEFTVIIIELSGLFSYVLEGGLETDSIDRFYLRLEQIVKQDREVAFVTSQTLMFWYHFVRNIKIEATERLGEGAKTKFESLSNKIKVLLNDFSEGQSKRR